MAGSLDRVSALAEPADPGRSAQRKIAWRLLPLFGLGYGIALMDRNNVGFAALQMNRDLHFSASIYGVGAGLFSIGYALFEIPSNLVLYRFGARRWMARILFTWGLLAIGMMFVRTATGFFAMRFALGVAEAGFFPGVLFYMLQWFPDNLRARAISGFYVAGPVVAITNGLLAGPLMSLQGRLDLRGWQWLFLLEGIPAVLLSGLYLFHLPDSPDEVKWLTPEERKWLKTMVASETRSETHLEDTWHALRDKRIWQLGVLSFCLLTCIYAYNLTAPIILRGVTGISIGSVGALMAVNGVLGMLSLAINAAHSDQTRERSWHLMIPLLIMAAAFVVAASTRSPWWVVPALAVAITGFYATQGIFYAIPGSFLKGKSAATGIALVTSMGILGGFAGPASMGWVKDATGSYQLGLATLAVPCLVGAAIMYSLRERLRPTSP